MAEFEFYGDALDCNAVAAAVLDGSNYVFVPNVCYEHPTAIEIRSANAEFETYLSINRTMFIAGPFTQRLSWHKLSAGRWAGHYVVRPEYDGALIQLRFPGRHDTGEARPHTEGVVSNSARVYLPALGIEVPLTPEAKMAFRDVVARVKSVCRPVQLSEGKKWVGRSLLNQASRAIAPKLLVNGLAIPLPRT